MSYSDNRRHEHIYNTDAAQCQRGHQPWASEANSSAKSLRISKQFKKGNGTTGILSFSITILP